MQQHRRPEEVAAHHEHGCGAAQRDTAKAITSATPFAASSTGGAEIEAPNTPFTWAGSDASTKSLPTTASMPAMLAPQSAMTPRAASGSHSYRSISLISRRN